MRSSRRLRELLAVVLMAVFVAWLAGSVCARKLSEEELDREWPKPKVILEYERALNLYTSGKSEEALAVLRENVGKPIVLAPDSVASSSWDVYGLFSWRRGYPAEQTLRRVAEENRAYGTRCAKEGREDLALRCFLVNLSLGQQAVHMKPVRMIHLLVGIGLYQQAFLGLRSVYNQRGNEVEAGKAYSIVQRTRIFVKQLVKPVTDREQREVKRWQAEINKLPEEKREEYAIATSPVITHTSFVDSVRLVKLWDRRITNDPALQAFISDVEKDAAP